MTARPAPETGDLRVSDAVLAGPLGEPLGGTPATDLYWPERILCPLCGRVVGVSYVLTDDVAPPRRYRRGFVRVRGGWAHPVRHLQELASGRLSRRWCGLAETGRRAP